MAGERIRVRDAGPRDLVGQAWGVGGAAYSHGDWGTGIETRCPGPRAMAAHA